MRHQGAPFAPDRKDITTKVTKVNVLACRITCMESSSWMVLDDIA